MLDIIFCQRLIETHHIWPILWCTNRLRNVLLLLWYQQTGLIANLMLGLIGCTAHTSNTWLTSLLSPPWLSSCTLQIYFSGPLISLSVHLYFYRSSKMKEHSSLKRKKSCQINANLNYCCQLSQATSIVYKKTTITHCYKFRCKSSTWHCKFPSLWQRYEQLGPRGLCWFLQDAGWNFEIGIEWIQC